MHLCLDCTVQLCQAHFSKQLLRNNGTGIRWSCEWHVCSYMYNRRTFFEIPNCCTALRIDIDSIILNMEKVAFLITTTIHGIFSWCFEVPPPPSDFISRHLISWMDAMTRRNSSCSEQCSPTGFFFLPLGEQHFWLFSSTMRWLKGSFLPGWQKKKPTIRVSSQE